MSAKEVYHTVCTVGSLAGRLNPFALSVALDLSEQADRVIPGDRCQRESSRCPHGVAGEHHSGVSGALPLAADGVLIAALLSLRPTSPVGQVAPQGHILKDLRASKPWSRLRSR